MSEAKTSVADEQNVRTAHGSVIVRAGQLVAASQQWQADGNMEEIGRVADGLQALHEGGSIEQPARGDYYDRQFNCLWKQIGFPKCLAKTKKQYISQFPKWPGWETRVHRHHSLLLPMEPRVDVVSLCQGFKVAFGGNDNTFEPWDEKLEKQFTVGPHWMWCQPGHHFWNWGPSVARSEGCAEKEWVCSDREAVQIWGLTGPYYTAIDAPRSVLRVSRGHAAYLLLCGGSPRLDYSWDGSPCRRFGSASRGECVGI